jgi:CHRD domain/PEP-CTERM motif
MLRLHIVIAALLSLLLLSAAARAEIVLFATLTNEAENPDAAPTLTSTGQPRPASFGTAQFVLNDAQNKLSVFARVFNIDFTGLQTPNDTNDNLTNAHIHAGAGVTPTTNAGVVWGFIGTPFNNTDNDGVTTPFANGVGGTFSGEWDLNEGQNTTLAAQLPFILSQRSYINFHTVQFPGGEVRGTLVIPEPSTLGLLGIAALGLFGLGMRRNSAAVAVAASRT